MSSLNVCVGAALAICLTSGAAQLAHAATPSFGQPISPADLAGEFSIPPSGVGLPAGSGTAAEGQRVYASVCAACHGDKLQGIKATGAPGLVGGRGSLTGPKPLKTVESYWPYATTLFDYIKRAMPFNAPGSLSDDQVYAVSAYILSEGHVIPASQPMNPDSLPKVRMPNAAGFIPDPRPN